MSPCESLWNSQIIRLSKDQNVIFSRGLIFLFWSLFIVLSQNLSNSIMKIGSCKYNVEARNSQVSPNVAMRIMWNIHMTLLYELPCTHKTWQFHTKWKQYWINRLHNILSCSASYRILYRNVIFAVSIW